MTSLLRLASGKFKTRRKSIRSRTIMPRRKSNTRRRVSAIGSGIGRKIPVIGKVLRNKTLLSVFAGIGAVSLFTQLALASRNPTLMRAATNPLVRGGVALAAGDIPGAVATFAIDRGIPNIGGMARGNNQQDMVVVRGGSGVA